MPRTKVVRAKKSHDREMQEVLKKLQLQVQLKEKQINEYTKNLIAAELHTIDQENSKRMVTVGPAGNKTIAELRAGVSLSIESISQIDRTKKKEQPKGRARRSVSYTEDDGYLTAESTGSQSSGRRSRSKSRAIASKTQTIRVSRSLSRSKMQNSVPVLNKYVTPMNGRRMNTFATVTPKVKPNTPSIVLRRPNQGEVAISLQGSPLMVNPVTSDEIANLNIPLLDGRMLTIQPKRGLRTSQIPNLDLNMQRQLQTLRDNLNKVCAIAASRK